MNQPTLLFLFWIIFASSHLFDVTVSSAIYQPDPTPDHSTSKRNNGFVTKHNESHFEVEVGDPTTSQPLLTAQSTSRIRLALSITHMALVILGVANIFVIVVILIKPYMRTITNVYIVSLCFADFVYLSNLLLVVSTQHNNRIWPFNSVLCTLYHGTESTGKYSSVLFVVLLAGDRFVAMCLPECVKYRTYTISITLSCMTWMVSVVVASPLYYFSELMHFKGKENTINTLCLVKWPTKDLGRLYIIGTSLLIFLIPLILIVYFYSHILAKMKEVLVRSKRMKRNSKTRAPYHRVTKLVLWVI
uniref:G_PROTEIN_RECEP_F1_2 domain-containing protein n=1 Tax=Rhabditophanes sp. KR3021 TaxID=114890 RepID=A0AC35TPF7_9BILA